MYYYCTTVSVFGKYAALIQVGLFLPTALTQPCPIPCLSIQSPQNHQSQPFNLVRRRGQAGHEIYDIAQDARVHGTALLVEQGQELSLHVRGRGRRVTGSWRREFQDQDGAEGETAGETWVVREFRQ